MVVPLLPLSCKMNLKLGTTVALNSRLQLEQTIHTVGGTYIKLFTPKKRTVAGAETAHLYQRAVLDKSQLSLSRPDWLMP